MLSDVKPGIRRMPNLTPLTNKQLRDAEMDKVYIFNVSPREHRNIEAGLRLYTIPGRKKGQRVSDPLVIPGMVYGTELKRFSGLHKEYEWVGREGIDIAREIIGISPFRSPTENLIPLGVFLSMSPEPSDEEIEPARALWLERCSQKVADGDALASINNGIVDVGGGRTASNIGKDHREALEELGLQRPWSGVNLRMVQCEECGTSNLPTAARCKNQECRAVFDEAKCRAKFPEMYAHEKVERGPGRPKIDHAAAS